MSWIDDAVIYQINLRSLAAREPRNAIEAAVESSDDESPLAYMTRSLSTIAKLGATVLYLVPPYPIGVLGRKGIGSPYSSRDFKAVEPEYGTLAEVKQFIARAHALEFKVIFDITPNHTSRDHIWTESHPEYYVHDADGELYYDFDWSDVAKLNYHNPGLCRAMIGVYDFWLSVLGDDENGTPRGIDGFRLDMAHMISDLEFWNVAMSELRDRHGSRDLLFLAESYGTENNIGLFRRGINAAYDDDFYKICQYLYGVDAHGDSIVHESPDAEHNEDFADKLAAYRTYGIAGAVKAALASYEELLAAGDGPWVARYTDNHDEGRGLHRFGAGAVRAVNQLLFMSPHCIPFLLTGQEFGALNRPSIHERMGVCDKGPRIVSESGVVDAQPGVEFEGNLFVRQHSERQSWYRFYQTLIHLRRHTSELTRGAFAHIDVGEDAPSEARTVVAFERRLEDSVVFCMVNMGGEPRFLTHVSHFEGNPLYGRLVDGVLEPFGAIMVRVVESS
jgi:glycosidase